MIIYSDKSVGWWMPRLMH